MKHVHYTDIKLEEPSEKGIKDLKVRWLISKKDGAEKFAMRLFEIQPEGYSPLHQHNWEHEVFILEGKGVAKDKNNEKPFKEGDVFFVPPMEWHQFVNTGKRAFEIFMFNTIYCRNFSVNLMPKRIRQVQHKLRYYSID